MPTLAKPHRPLAVLLVALAAAAPMLAGCTSSGQSPRHAASSPPPARLLPRELVAALNKTSVHVSPAAATATAAVAEGAAVRTALRHDPPGSEVVAAQLVYFVGGAAPAPRLAWACYVEPAGGTGRMSGPSGKPLNYDVEFVDATTGDWLQGTEGYDAGLPQLRSRG